MKPWRRSAGWGCLIFAVVVGTSGCSVMIAESGLDNPLESARYRRFRDDVPNFFGAPAATGSCPDGRQFDRFRVRQKIPGLWKALYWSRHPGSVLFEPIFTPVAAIASEVMKVRVTVVYGPDERVDYAFTDRREWRFYEATQPLTSDVRSALHRTEPSTWALQVAAYTHELRRRAACTGTALTAEDEAALAELIPIVEEGAWGIATTGQALGKFDAVTQRFHGPIRN